MDPTTRHLVFIACGIGMLLLVLIGGWALSGRHTRAIPVIEASAGPVRLKPVDPGGMQAMGAQAPPAIAASGDETLAPRPEVARPEALQAEVDAARRSDDPEPEVPVASPAVRTPVEPLARPALPSATARVPVTQDQAGLAHAPSVAAAVHMGRGGHLAVQLAALDSHDAAQTEWSRLSHSHPSLFTGHAAEIEPADHDGRPIYRLRTGGFATAADAHGFCEQARAQHVACTVADF